jgi:hypothetical protein
MPSTKGTPTVISASQPDKPLKIQVEPDRRSKVETRSRDTIKSFENEGIVYSIIETAADQDRTDNLINHYDEAAATLIESEGVGRQMFLTRRRRLGCNDLRSASLIWAASRVAPSGKFGHSALENR